MDILYKIFIDPFVQMGTSPDLLVQTLWDGLVAGVLYALIALGFVLIFKASGVFNFAQGIMVVFAALTLVGLARARRAGLCRARAHRRRDVCARLRRRAAHAAAVGQSVGHHSLHGHLRPDLFSRRSRPARVRRQPEGDDRLRALSAARRARIQSVGRLRVTAKNRYRGGHHRLDHGRGARGLLSSAPASGGRCARSPTAIRLRSRSASRSNRSG